MKHWRPEDTFVEIRPGRSAEWLSPEDLRALSPVKPRAEPSAAAAGLVLVAAACVGIVAGLDYVLGPPPFADAAPSVAIPYFGYCRTGGGPDCVVDGETFYLGEQKVRVAGIEVPETHPSRCPREARLGEVATEKLHALLNSGAVTIAPIGRGRDTDGLVLATVKVDGRDVSQAMVRSGFARPESSPRNRWC